MGKKKKGSKKSQKRSIKKPINKNSINKKPVKKSSSSIFQGVISKIDKKAVMLAALLIVLLSVGIVVAIALFGGQPSSGDGSVGTGTQSDDNTACAHTETVLENAVDATCISEGYTGDLKCVSCGQLIEQGATIEITDHKWNDGIITKNPTCVSAGSAILECETCHAIENKALDIIPCDIEYHFEANEAHMSVCSYCYGNKIEEHNKGEKVESIGATCNEAAYTVYYCDECDSNFKVYDPSNPAIGHDWNIDAPEIIRATCISEGEQYFVCKNEGCNEKSRAISLESAPFSHRYQLTERTEPSCTSAGLEKYICADCGEKSEIELQRLSHTLTVAVKDGNWSYLNCDCGYKASQYTVGESDEASINVEMITDNSALLVEFKNATIEFPQSVSDAFKNEYYSISVAAIELNEVEKAEILRSPLISDEERAAFEKSSAAIFNFSVECDGIEVHAFSEKVSVTLFYDLGANDRAEGIVIRYVTAGGELEAVQSVSYDSDRGKVAFDVDHFSLYAMAYLEAPELKCEMGEHDYSDENLWNTVGPSCEFYGYTVKQCKYCGYSIVDSLKSIKDHELGDKTEPIVDCDHGGYVYQKCKNCSYVKNYEYRPAKGHSLKSFADCLKAGICETCDKVIVPAYNHAWSDWYTSKESTEDENEIRFRVCPICGEREEKEIPYLTEDMVWDIDSYSQYFDFLLNSTLVGESKTSEITLTCSDKIYHYRVAVERKGEDCLAHIICEISEGDLIDQYEAFYKNGTVIVTENDGISVLDVNEYGKLFPDAVEMLDFVRNILDTHGEDINSAFDSLNKLLEKYIELYGDSADKLLGDNGYKYTVRELSDAVRLMWGFYATFSQRLGVEVILPEGVEYPSKNDINYLLSIFADVNSNGETTEYNFDLSKIRTCVSDALSALESEYDSMLCDALYNVLGEAITAHFAELDSYDKLFERVKQKYGGSVKLKTVINDIISLAEESEAYTVDEIYSMLEMLLSEAIGKRVEIGEWAKLHSDKTLSQIVKEQFGDDMTVAKLYGNIDKYMRETALRDWILYENAENKKVTFADRLEDVKAKFDELAFGGAVSISLNGSALISKLDMHLTYDKITVDVIVDDAENTLAISENIGKYFDFKAESHVDSNGNLVISGFPADADITFEISGKLDISLREALIRDISLSGELGIDVYTLNDYYCAMLDDLTVYYTEYDGYYYQISYCSDGESELRFALPFVKVSVEGLKSEILPDGRIVYITDVHGNLDSKGTLSGYIAVGEGLYACIDCDYRNGALEEIRYIDKNNVGAYAPKYLSVDADKIIDIDKYVEVNSEGSVVISSEVIEMLRNSCHSWGNSVSVDIIAQNGDYGVQYVISHNVAFNLSESHRPVTNAIHDSGREINVTQSKNGDVVIIPDHRTNITVDFEFDMSMVDLSDVLKYSLSDSNSLGFKVYSVACLSDDHKTERSLYANVCGKYVNVKNMPYVGAEAAYGAFSANVTIVYGADTPDGWVYYRDYVYGEDGIELIDEIEITDGDLLFKKYYAATAHDGSDIFAFAFYSQSSYDTVIINGAEVICSNEVTGLGYAKLGDNAFVKGRISCTDGKYDFIPDNWYGDEIDSKYLSYELDLHKYIWNENGILHISSEILSILEKYSNCMNLKLSCEDKCENDGLSISYNELLTWFK